MRRHTHIWNLTLYTKKHTMRPHTHTHTHTQTSTWAGKGGEIKWYLTAQTDKNSSLASDPCTQSQSLLLTHTSKNTHALALPVLKPIHRPQSQSQHQLRAHVSSLNICCIMSWQMHYVTCRWFTLIKSNYSIDQQSYIALQPAIFQTIRSVLDWFAKFLAATGLKSGLFDN